MKSLFPIICLCSWLIAAHSFAGSATWSANPVSGDWNTAANWTPNTVPNGPEDVAIFGSSALTAPSVSAATEVSGIIFDVGASSFFLRSAGSLTISGAGITNDSETTQSLISDHYGQIFFSGSATAGNPFMVFTNRGSTADNPEAGVTVFADQAKAGHATFINNPAEVAGLHAGQTGFFNDSSAGNGTFICEGAAIAGAYPGFVYFSDGTTAGNGTFVLIGGGVSGAEGGYVNLFGNDTVTGAGAATFTLNGGSVQGAGGGSLYFLQGSLAEDAMILANGGSGGGQGGTVYFTKDSRGMRARIKLLGNGALDISSHEGSGVTIASLDGNGLVFLGRHNLSIGANNLSSKFAGVISQTGSLTKVGGGNLALSGSNTYSGGTTIRNGTLRVANASGSATGSGAVAVERGKVEGSGFIAGTVAIGTGAGAGALLTPGTGKTLETLTIQSLLTLNVDATYEFAMDTSVLASDEVVAQGTTINGATLLYGDYGSAVLPPGTVFTVISNTSADPIVGVFNNLPDGAIVTVGGNTYQASYQGGDGNDLTLTVVQ
jgi:autotransporter-associated beta strand protein